MRLRKEEILRKRGEIKPLFSSHHRLSGPTVVIKYLKREKRGILFATSRKIKRATQRNLLKRRLREIYRCNKDWFPQNYHFLLYAKEKAVNKSFAELKSEIESLMKGFKDE